MSNAILIMRDGDRRMAFSLVVDQIRFENDIDWYHGSLFSRPFITRRRVTIEGEMGEGRIWVPGDPVDLDEERVLDHVHREIES